MQHNNTTQHTRSRTQAAAFAISKLHHGTRRLHIRRERFRPGRREGAFRLEAEDGLGIGHVGGDGGLGRCQLVADAEDCAASVRVGERLLAAPDARRVVDGGVGAAGGALHVEHGVGDDGLLAEGEQAVGDVLEEAALGEVDLLAAPEAVAPVGGVVCGGPVGVVEEFHGDDEGAEDEQLGVDAVDVLLLGPGARVEGRGRRGGVQGAVLAPGQGEAGVQRVEDAGCEGDGLDGWVGPGQDCLDERDGGRGEGGRGRDEVREVHCWA